MSGQHSFLDALLAVVRTELSSRYSFLPGQIETYDATKRLATVKPLLKVVTPTGAVVTLPVLVDVPVIWPSVAGGRIRFPLPKGSAVALYFCSRSLDRWIANASGVDVEPGTARESSLSDAVALPGLWSPAGLDDPAEDGLEVYYDGKITITNGTDSIVFDGGEIRAAGGAALAKADHTHELTPVNVMPADPMQPVEVQCGSSDSNTSVLKGG